MALQGSNQVVSINIHVGWTPEWSSVYPRVSESELNGRFDVDRALLFKDLIYSLPRLQHLTLGLDTDSVERPMPSTFFEYESLPEVQELTLSLWSFSRIGPNSLQSQIRPTTLQKLSLVNVWDTNNLFDILAWHDVRLTFLHVRFVWGILVPVSGFATFLTQQRSLEELVLEECGIGTQPTLGCVQQNKTSLKRLDLHLHEHRPERAGQVTFDASLLSGHLRLIRKTCSALETLSIDLDLQTLLAVSPPLFPYLNLGKHLSSSTESLEIFQAF